MNINNPTTFSTPDLTLSTSNSSGVAGALRADDTVLVYDGTLPANVTTGTANTGSASTSARRDHIHSGAIADTNDLVLIGTVVASDDATLTITGIDSTYDSYMVALSDIRPASSGYSCRFRFGDTSGIDSGASDYNYYTSFGGTDAATFQVGRSSTYDAVMLALEGVSNGTNDGLTGTWFLNRPTDGTVKPMIFGNHIYWNGSNTFGGYVLGARNAQISLDRIQLDFTSGNITSGRMTIWGCKHA